MQAAFVASLADVGPGGDADRRRRRWRTCENAAVELGYTPGRSCADGNPAHRQWFSKIEVSPRGALVIPDWLHVLSIAFLLLGLLCAVVITADEWQNPQHMWIMNIVWPVTALFGTVIWLWAYFRYGRLATKERVLAAEHEGRDSPNKRKPFAAMVAEGASHCGGGCTLGDICAEWLAFGVPIVAVWLGWQSIFPEKIFAVWILDYLFAYAFGVVFQYFTIAPMRDLGIAEGVWAAIKADTLSLTAWQVGMYGFMAVAYFWIFRSNLGVELKPDTVEFWFMMQIAMLCGFVTSYPVNWWLLRAGVKEMM